VTDLDTLAKEAGATHKDKVLKRRYYRLNSWIGHCETVEPDPTMTKYNQFWNWRYFGSKLPVTAVEL